MDVKQLIRQLEVEIAEKETASMKLDTEIVELQTSVKLLKTRSGGAATPKTGSVKNTDATTRKPHGRVYTPEQKQAMSKRLKQVWAAKKKGKKKS